MPQALPLVVILAVAILIVAFCAQLLVNRTFNQAFLEEHHSILDPLLGVVGTLFSVLLGFMVGGAMDRYHDSVVNVDLEANSVMDVFRLSQGLESDDRVRLRNLCREYTAKVVELEWKEMKEQSKNESARECYQEIWESALAIDPGSDERINNIQQSLLDAVKNLGENRRARIVASRHGLNLVQWLVIGLGGAITVLFCLFFPMRKAIFHTFFTGLVAVSLGLNIWLLSAYSTPFSGELQIQPYMFTLQAGKVLAAPDTPPRYLREERTAALTNMYSKSGNPRNPSVPGDLSDLSRSSSGKPVANNSQHKNDNNEGDAD